MAFNKTTLFALLFLPSFTFASSKDEAIDIQKKYALNVGWVNKSCRAFSKDGNSFPCFLASPNRLDNITDAKVFRFADRIEVIYKDGASNTHKTVFNNNLTEILYYEEAWEITKARWEALNYKKYGTIYHPQQILRKLIIIEDNEILSTQIFQVDHIESHTKQVSQDSTHENKQVDVVSNEAESDEPKISLEGKIPKVVRQVYENLLSKQIKVGRSLEEVSHDIERVCRVLNGRVLVDHQNQTYYTDSSNQQVIFNPSWHVDLSRQISPHAFKNAAADVFKVPIGTATSHPLRNTRKLQGTNKGTIYYVFSLNFQSKIIDRERVEVTIEFFLYDRQINGGMLPTYPIPHPENKKDSGRVPGVPDFYIEPKNFSLIPSLGIPSWIVAPETRMTLEALRKSSNCELYDNPIYY